MSEARHLGLNGFKVIELLVFLGSLVGSLQTALYTKHTSV